MWIFFEIPIGDMWVAIIKFFSIDRKVHTVRDDRWLKP
ncbi:MAG: hypothetical protein KatS3mg051_2081 [Anaerolineae bacterium]|nr:MAG: hypothetical protein KatS3mg051_2081 [Anaerolineae bacterium]